MSDPVSATPSHEHRAEERIENAGNRECEPERRIGARVAVRKPSASIAEIVSSE
jgi:hypothetical protein